MHLTPINLFVVTVAEEKKNDELMTTGDIAKYLGLTSQYIQTMARREQLPIAETTAGGIRLFRRSDIERLAEERRRNPPRPGPSKGRGGRPKKKAAKVTKKITTKESAKA